MYGCHKCCKMTALLILIVGICFLFVDLGKWSFWNLNWWTAVFLIMGITCLAKSGCKECKKVCK